MLSVAFAAKLGICAEAFAHTGISSLAPPRLVGHTFPFSASGGLMLLVDSLNVYLSVFRHRYGDSSEVNWFADIPCSTV